MPGGEHWFHTEEQMRFLDHNHEKTEKAGRCAFIAHPSFTFGTSITCYAPSDTVSARKFFKAIDNREIMHYSIVN